MTNARGTALGGDLFGGPGFDDAHDIAFLHDEQVVAIQPDLRTGPFAQEDPVPGLHVERLQLAAFVAGTRTNGEDLAFLGLFLGGVGNDDATGCLLVGFDAPDQDAVVQWTKRHVILPSRLFNGLLASHLGWARARDQISRAHDLVSGFSGFKRPTKIFWHSNDGSAKAAMG